MITLSKKLVSSFACLSVLAVGSAAAADQGPKAPEKILKIADVPGLAEVPPGSVALVVARRHRGIGGGALRFEMRLNGTTIADLGKRDYAVAYLEPGSYTLESHMYASIVPKQLVDTRQFDVTLESSPFIFIDVSGRGSYMVQRSESEAPELLKGMLLTRSVRYADMGSDPARLARAAQERASADAAQRSFASTRLNQTLAMGGITSNESSSAALTLLTAQLARPGDNFWSGAFAVLGGVLEGAIKSGEFMQANGQLAADDLTRLTSLTAAARTIQNLGQAEGADASKIFENLSTASRALAGAPGKSADTITALQSLAAALDTAGQVARNPDAANESNTALVRNAVSQFVNTYAERKLGGIPTGVHSVAPSAPASTLDQNGCIKEIQWLAGSIRTPELAAGLVSVDAAIQSAGGLNRAILLTRAQIRELEETYAVNNSNAEAGAFPEEFRRMRIMTEDSLLMNRTYLRAFECRRKAGAS